MPGDVCPRPQTVSSRQRLRKQRLRENSMQQVLFRARASRTIDAMMRDGIRLFVPKGRFADSESRILATKIFSCTTLRALAGARPSHLLARIASRRFGGDFTVRAG